MTLEVKSRDGFIARMEVLDAKDKVLQAQKSFNAAVQQYAQSMDALEKAKFKHAIAECPEGYKVDRVVSAGTGSESDKVLIVAIPKGETVFGVAHGGFSNNYSVSLWGCLIWDGDEMYWVCPVCLERRQMAIDPHSIVMDDECNIISEPVYRFQCGCPAQP